MIHVDGVKTGMPFVKIILSVLVFVTSLAFGEETNLTLTVDGVTYTEVRFSQSTAYSVSIFHSTGVASIPLEKLPPDLQKKFGYDPEKAQVYRAAEIAASQRQREYDKQRAAEAKEAAREAAKPPPKVRERSQPNERSAVNRREPDPTEEQRNRRSAVSAEIESLQADVNSLQTQLRSLGVHGGATDYVPGNPLTLLTYRKTIKEQLDAKQKLLDAKRKELQQLW